MPWVHCHVTTSGDVRACCVSPVRFGSLRQNTLAEIWHGTEITKFRAEHLSGKSVSGCERCYVTEQAGQHSMRQNANEFLGSRAAEWVNTTDKLGNASSSRPIDYDIRFSNVCNLKCRSCGHESSSSWFSDAKAIYGFTIAPQPTIRAFDTPQEFWRAFDGFVNDVEKIAFAGGEPLYSDEHYEVLRALHERRKFDVLLYYNTNFSVLEYHGIDVTKYWRDFRRIFVAASLDGSGARGEVLRSGLSWSKVLANRERLRRECPNVNFRVTCTVSALNVWHITEFHRELIESEFIAAEDIELNILQIPEHLSSQILPSNLKKEIEVKLQQHAAWLRNLAETEATRKEKLYGVAAQFEAVVHYMNAQDASNRIPLLWLFTQALDGLRHEDSALVFPELKSLISTPSASV